MTSSAEHFSLDKEDVLHPVNQKIMMWYQQNNKHMIEIAKLNKEFN